jgi:hypothetical protein
MVVNILEGSSRIFHQLALHALAGAVVEPNHLDTPKVWMTGFMMLHMMF